MYLRAVFFDVVRNRTLLTKRRSKVNEKKMSRDRVLNYDQWKIFSEN